MELELLIDKYLYECTDYKEWTKIVKRSILKQFALFLKNKYPFEFQDVLDYLNSERFKKYKIITQNKSKANLRLFFKWLGIFDKKYARILKKCREITKELKKSDLLTKSEIKEILKRMRRPIDKAIFILLLESKMRKSELRNLKIKDLTCYDSYAMIYIEKSKSAQRNIPLIESIPYLMRYLEDHPEKDNPEAWLFGHTRNGIFRKYSKNGIWENIKRNTKFIPKNVYPHLLRHTGLTQIARHLNEFSLGQLAGWKPGSRMASRYVHLSQDDLENSMLELYNIKKPDEDHEVGTIEVIQCPRCEYQNSELDHFCSRCGSVLDQKTVLEHKEKAQELEEIISKSEIRAYIDKLFEEKLRIVKN